MALLRARQGRWYPLAWLMAIAFAALVPGAISGAGADAVYVEEPGLPNDRDIAAVTSNANHVYLFGGFQTSTGSYLDEVLDVDTASRSARVAGRLPVALAGATAAWADGRAYVFGGSLEKGGLSAAIFSFDPATGVVTRRAARLPSARQHASAVWTGSAIYVLGGVDGGNLEVGDIVRYDPITDTVATMSGRVPDAAGRREAGAIWNATTRRVYGIGGARHLVSQPYVWSYDPANDTVEPFVAKLPMPVRGFGLSYDGRDAYLFGGRDDRHELRSDIIRFNPVARDTVTMGATLPSPRAYAAAAYDGRYHFVFGGLTAPGTVDDVLRYSLAPGAPRNPRAVPGLQPGSITLTWEPPYANTYVSPITAYRIYRGPLTHNPPYLTTVPAGARTFVDQGLQAGMNYHYVVRAVNAAGEGSGSIETCNQPAPSPDVPDKADCLLY